MVLDQHIAGKTDVAMVLLSTQRFFDELSRDIVDESDENFNVKFELIYTMGSQRPVESGPDRWIHIGDLLAHVKSFTAQVMESLPSSMMRHDAPPGAFPYTRILRLDAGRLLEELIAKKVCETGFRGFPLARQPSHVRKAVYTYITKWNLTAQEADLVEISGSFFTDSIKPTLYLLRGLIAGGILVFVLFRKRWCVNYGLDTQRTPPTSLAVPYRSKDQPSLRSDFSHPDVVILLTHLSYYYGGLSNDDLFLAFENLLDSDQKDVEYQDWIKDVSDLPKSFRHLQGINMEDRSRLIKELFPCLRRVKSVVDFFLNTVVFPKGLRVFPEKLSASGWDIGKAKRYPTTAFSGTCDTHPLLPLATEHLNLPHQRHTNALVLNHLLQPENQVLILPSVSTGDADAKVLLDAVMNTDPRPRVIIDVGALVLDLSNEQIAKIWLEKHTSESAEAAIFFDDYDELTSIDRAGNVERLQTSPFRSRLCDCIVFLDEAHTRGTDLKLPIHYRAAVTLGPYLTKDRLVQACMRMRQLGKGQNIVFLVNDEIRRKIQECIHKEEDSEITLPDVLRWTIHETHLDIRRNMSLWAKQGRNFVRQSTMWHDLAKSGPWPSAEASRFLEPEARSLESRYRPHKYRDGDEEEHIVDHLELESIASRLRQCLCSGEIEEVLEEEQEKELSPEMQEERQIQRPGTAVPAKHTLHPDLLKFATTAIVDEDSVAYQPLFESLKCFSAASAFDTQQLNGNGILYATKDFARTTEPAPGPHVSDSYLRSVQWILIASVPADNGAIPAIAISPYEAQQLIPKLHVDSATALYIFKPHWNTGLAALNQLDFFHFPPSKTAQRLSPESMAQLNIFAGSPCFKTFQEYIDTCAFLRLAHQNSRAGTIIANDGFIMSDDQDPSTVAKKPHQSPVAFVQALMNTRAHHKDLSKSHMGKLLGGAVLGVTDVEG